MDVKYDIDNEYCKVEYIKNVEIFQQSLESSFDNCKELCKSINCDGFKYDLTKQPNCIFYKKSDYIQNKQLLYLCE